MKPARAELEAMADHGAVLVAGYDDDRRATAVPSAGTAGRKIPERLACSDRAARGRSPATLSSAAAILSKSCATAISASGAAAEHSLPQTADHQRVIVGNQDADHTRIHVTLRRPRGPAVRQSRNPLSLSRPRHRRKSNLRGHPESSLGGLIPWAAARFDEALRPKRSLRRRRR